MPNIRLEQMTPTQKVAALLITLGPSAASEVMKHIEDESTLEQITLEIAGLSADLVVDNKFVVECDGVEDKTPSKISNMKKQAIIERSGLKVSRISKREWDYSPKACLDRIINCNS